MKMKKMALQAALAFTLLVGSVGIGTLGADKASALSDTVVIAEVFNASSANGEWVTLANVGNAAVDLAGWKLQDYSAAGNPQTAWTFPAVTIAPNSLLVVERTAGASDAQATGVNSIVGGAFNFAADSDRLDLINGSTLVDGVAWGATNSVEGFSVPADGFVSGTSLERTSRTDTDTAADWALVTANSSAGEWAPLADIGTPVVLSRIPADGSTLLSTSPEVKAAFNYGAGQTSGTAELVLRQGVTQIASNNVPVSLGNGEFELVLNGLNLIAGNEYTAELTVTSAGGTTVSAWSFRIFLLGAGGIVISEIYPDAFDETNSEFFELYNPTDSIVDISGYSFGSISAAGNEAEQGVIPPGTELEPGAYYLIGDAFELADGLGTWPNPDLVTPLTIANSNGTYWVKDTAGNFVDRVAWGASNTNGEGTAYPSNPPAGTSLERRANDGSSPLPGQPGEFLGNGWDTDNNVADFVLRLLPEPQNSFSPVEP